MAYLVLIPTAALLVVLQTTLLPRFELLDGRADLVLLLVVGWAMTGRVVQAMVTGLVAGMLLDLLSGIPLGVSAIALIAAANVATLAQGRLWRAHQFAALGAVLIATAVYYTVLGSIALLIYPGTDLVHILTRVVLPATILNLILAIPAIQLAGGLERSLYPSKVVL
ncbi:MAG: rod shape-determining protein MreD [Anaerolineales bacterium]|nr:rod shape-determining protein MreD [Anaerolineales bacterium]